MYPNPFSGRQPEPERLPTEPEQVEELTVGDMSDIDIIAHDPVMRMRATRLAAMGFTPQQSRVLALDRARPDLHVIERLLARGCPPHIAFDIMSS